MERLVSIGKAAKIDISKIKPELVHTFDSKDKRKTIAYARAANSDQESDLERQTQMLELFCSQNGWTFELITDIGSGVNYYKKGLTKLLDMIISGNIGRLVLAHKDRLLSLGAELVFSVCEAENVEVVIINKGDDAAFEEDLATDVQEIIAIFSARLYGARSKKNKKLLDSITKAVEDSINDSASQNQMAPE